MREIGGGAFVLATALKAIVFFTLLMVCVAFATYVERRLAAFVQDRSGPNRVGPIGLLQPVADALKNLLKEETWPAAANHAFFLYVGNRLSPAARNAHAILPVTTFAEREGTFTNFEGRIQRFHQALQPAGLARPAWLVLARLVSLLEDAGATAEPTLASEAFQVMVRATPAMADLEWASVGLKGARLGSTEAAVPHAQAPADGA